MLPFRSLNAAAAPGPGSSRDLEGTFARHQMVATLTTSGSTTNCTVALEGSHDGVNWFVLAPEVSFSTNTGSVRASEVAEALVRFVRADVTSLSGGTSPTVTATIGSI